MKPVLLLVATALVLGACSGTEGGNPVRAKMSLTARTSDPAVAALGGDAPPGGLNVDGVWVVLREVRLEQADACDQPDAIVRTIVPGPLALPLAGDGSVETFDVEAGGYCRLRLSFDAADAGDLGSAPGELLDHSVIVQGTRGDGVPVTMLSRQRMPIELRSHGAPFDLDPDAPALILAFDAAAWLAGVDLSSADVAGGAIRIDEMNNRLLENQFDANLRAAMQLFRDRNGDGRLTADESSDVLAD